MGLIRAYRQLRRALERFYRRRRRRPRSPERYARWAERQLRDLDHPESLTWRRGAHRDVRRR